jgi:hypothetical protein
VALMRRLAALCQQQGGLAASIDEEPQLAFGLLRTASQLHLALAGLQGAAGKVAAGSSGAALQAAVKAACCAAFQLLEDEPGRTAPLDVCRDLIAAARHQLQAEAGGEGAWQATAPALRLLQLEFAAATYGQDQHQQKAVLQAMVQHPDSSVRALTSCGYLSSATGRPWSSSSSNVACIAFGFALRLAMEQQLPPQDAQEAAAAVSALLSATSSNAVRLKVCERAVQLMAHLQQQGQAYPAAQLQWLCSTCWNHSARAQAQGDDSGALRYMQLALQMLRQQPREGCQHLQALMQQGLEQLQQKLQARSAEQEPAPAQGGSKAAAAEAGGGSTRACATPAGTLTAVEGAEQEQQPEAAELIAVDPGAAEGAAAVQDAAVSAGASPALAAEAEPAPCSQPRASSGSSALDARLQAPVGTAAGLEEDENVVQATPESPAAEVEAAAAPLAALPMLPSPVTAIQPPTLRHAPAAAGTAASKSSPQCSLPRAAAAAPGGQAAPEATTGDAAEAPSSCAAAQQGSPQAPEEGQGQGQAQIQGKGKGGAEADDVMQLSLEEDGSQQPAIPFLLPKMHLAAAPFPAAADRAPLRKPAAKDELRLTQQLEGLRQTLQLQHARSAGGQHAGPSRAAGAEPAQPSNDSPCRKEGAGAAAEDDDEQEEIPATQVVCTDEPIHQPQQLAGPAAVPVQPAPVAATAEGDDEAAAADGQHDSTADGCQQLPANNEEDGGDKERPGTQEEGGQGPGGAALSLPLKPAAAKARKGLLMQRFQPPRRQVPDEPAGKPSLKRRPGHLGGGGSSADSAAAAVDDAPVGDGRQQEHKRLRQASGTRGVRRQVVMSDSDTG